MKQIQMPEFKDYAEEAAFWDNLDTADSMENDGEWIHLADASKRAIRVAMLPEVADERMRRAHTQGVSAETLVNVLFIERIHHLAIVS